VESYFLLNRRLALARPAAARRSARRFPKAGLALEAMLVAFVGLPVMIAAAAQPEVFLVAGGVALGLQEMLALWRWFTIGHDIALAESDKKEIAR